MLLDGEQHIDAMKNIATKRSREVALKTTSTSVCENDQEVVHQLCQKAQHSRFTWAALRHVSNKRSRGELASEKLQEYFKKIDRRVGIALKKLPQNSIFIVIFSGRRENHAVQNGACFLTVI